MILSTSTNIFFERRFEDFVPMKKCLEMCEKSGYKYLDFGFAELALVSERFKGEQWKDELNEYKTTAEKAGLSFVQAHATIFDFCNPGADYEEKKRLFERSITGAKLLGASWIVVHPSRKCRVFQKICRFCKKRRNRSCHRKYVGRKDCGSSPLCSAAGRGTSPDRGYSM